RLESRRVFHVHPVTPPDGEGLARFAQQVLALNLNKRVVLATVHESGIDDHAQAFYNIQDTAAGKQARRSSYSNDGLPAAPGGTVLLDQRLLTTMLVSPANPYYVQFAQLCARLGATQLFHPGNDAHH